MKALKAELDALRDVLLTPLSEFISEKEAESRTQEKAEALAQARMFTAALEAVDKARADRTYFMVVLRHGTPETSTMLNGFGPYSTRDQAIKAVESLLTVMDPTLYAIIPCRNHHGAEAKWVQADQPPSERAQWAEIRRDAQAFKRGWRGNRRDRDQYLDAS